MPVTAGMRLVVHFVWVAVVDLQFREISAEFYFSLTGNKLQKLIYRKICEFAIVPIAV